MHELQSSSEHVMSNIHVNFRAALNICSSHQIVHKHLAHKKHENYPSPKNILIPPYIAVLQGISGFCRIPPVLFLYYRLKREEHQTLTVFHPQ